MPATRRRLAAARSRITVFGPDLEYEGEWRIRGSSFSATPLHVDEAGRVYLEQFDYHPEGSRRLFIVFSDKGQPLDTFPVPAPADVPRLVALRPGSEGRTSSARPPVRLTRDAVASISDPV